LKTAVAQLITAQPNANPADIAAAFQAACAAVLADRADHALRMMPDANLLVVAGGVAANTRIRTALQDVAARHGKPFVAPPVRLCTDNAVMVAWAAVERLRTRWQDDMETLPRPRWPLSELSP
jgi:N6-L-threonylcarbamoyladenine synthase